MQHDQRWWAALVQQAAEEELKGAARGAAVPGPRRLVVCEL